MSTVLKKGAPSRSYPSRQRKLGPAPFASFEDLSDELESPADQQGAEPPSKMEALPEMKEECPGGDCRPHQPVTATSSTSTVTFAHSAPTSGPTSGLQTPSTPRIDISCASSSTPPSEDSASEKELFQGGLGFAFHEEGTEELRSSTEELELGEMDIDSEEEKRRKRAASETESELYRRASHPANIFSRRKSSAIPPEEDEGQRKPSAHSLFLDGLLSRPTRHASFGAADYGRPGAFSSLSAHSSGSVRGRSPSPHKMMLETSFCGSKPIPTKSMDMDSPPKEEPKAASTANIATLQPTATPPRSPKSPRDFDSRRPSYGRRSVSPFKMVYETSFCGNKPIPTRSMEQESPPKEAADYIVGNSLVPTTLTTVQVHQHVPLESSSPAASPDLDKRSGRRTSSPESPKSSDHWRPVSPRVASASPSPTPCTSSSISSVIFVNKKAEGSPDQAARNPNKKRDTNIFKWPEPATPTPPPKRKTNEKSEKCEKSEKVENKRDSPGELLDEITTEMKISEEPTVTVEDAAVPLESKGLFQTSDSFDEDGDLPYVPTTLPQEKSTVVPIFPSKERRSQSVTTTPVQRPRVNRPANPASLHDYIAYSTLPKGDESKMKINLPREDSLTDYTPNRVKSPRKTSATSWTDFAEMGLRSPREIRRKLQEENGALDDLGSYHSDSSEAVCLPANGSDDEADAMLKLPKAPFGMDLDVHSNRSSNISQEHSPALSPSASSPALENLTDSSTRNQQD